MTTSQTFNGFGQVETITYPGPGTPFEVHYDYDSGGNLNRIGSLGFAQTYWQLTTAYQGQRPETEIVGAYTTKKGYYDDTGHLQSVATFTAPSGPDSQVVQQVAFAYDANGNLNQRTYYVGDTGGTEIFTPDNLDRLTSITQGTATTFGASYGPEGNLNTLSNAEGNYSYTFPLGSPGPAHAPYAANNATYEYYSTGSLKTRTGASVSGFQQMTTVDGFDRPTRVDFQNPAGSVEYDYQATGERSRKLLSDGTQVLYSGGYERKTTAAGVEHKYRILSPNGPLMEVNRDDAGQELSRVFLYLDPRGSPKVITDATGNVLHRQKFGPFGAVDQPSWESTDPTVRRVTRGFGGHEHDAETGLVNMGARLYDASIGRFTSADLGVQIPSWTQAYDRGNGCHN